jgi:tRNA(Arg) A34 adenosine deaminase TadA
MFVQPRAGSEIEITTQDKAFLRRAIELATENALSTAGGPFGCVIVREGRVVAEGVNRVTADNDPSAHAEIVAIRRACDALGTFRLDGCTLYANSEPCPMCLGAIYWSRAERVVYACTRHDAARAGFDDVRIYGEIARPASERGIRMVQALRDEALAAFEAWARSEGKIAY